jgi:hypothetical protein
VETLHIGAAMQITLIPDNSIASAPAGLTAAVEAAASVFEQDFPGNYNVNISYGWGTFDNTPSDVLTNPGDFSLGGGPLSLVSYSELKDWLTADATSSAQITAVASLPASAASLPGDPSIFTISPAEEKALGVFSGDSGAVDGSIGFNVGDASSPEAWEPAALCEIAHAPGLGNYRPRRVLSRRRGSVSLFVLRILPVDVRAARLLLYRRRQYGLG